MIIHAASKAHIQHSFPQSLYFTVDPFLGVMHYSDYYAIHRLVVKLKAKIRSQSGVRGLVKLRECANQGYML